MTEPQLRVDPDQLCVRLCRELALIDWRALIVVVVAPPELAEAADASCLSATRHAEIAEDRIVRHVVRRGAAGRTRLQELNRARDTLLKERRLIYLRASSAAEVRFLREVAPDLCATIDVFVELEQPGASTPADWDACRASLCALMRDRHATLDFTGLLPASAEQRELPLDELYQPLVDASEPGSLFEQPKLEHGYLVLGHPGTGKTTYVRHLAWTYAQVRDDPLELGAKVPLLLSLSDYAHARNERVQSLVEYLPRWLTEHEVAHADALTEHLPEVLLMLDGLDEMRSPEARAATLRELAELLRTQQVGGVVVTGRSFLIDELSKHDLGLRLHSTRQPTPEQARAFVTSFVRLRRGRCDHELELIARIEGDRDLQTLARTPLMLAFMVILDELEGRLPDRRIEIYYRLGELLVERWTRARSIGASTSQHQRPTRADALRVLGPLAWWTLERGGGTVFEQALLLELRRIEERRETRAEAGRRADALLELLRSDTALLVPLPGRRWSFVHSSIAEYFAGVEAERDHERWRALLDQPFRAEWREVLLFCAGQLGVIDGRTAALDQLIDAVLAKSRRPGRYDAKYASLLIGLLAEGPGLSRRQTDRLADRLLQLALDMAYPYGVQRQIQTELVTLLRDARGSSADGLTRALRERFTDQPHSFDWTRVLFVIEIDKQWVTQKLGSVSPETMAGIVLAPLVASLVGPWVERLGIDLGPTLELWSKRDDWVYRLAAWWVQSDPNDRSRPFREIVDQLPD